MAKLKDYIKPGISATMLYPGAFTNEQAHLAAVEGACRLPDYEILDLYLPQDPAIREREMEMLGHSGKEIYLNSPALL